MIKAKVEQFLIWSVFGLLAYMPFHVLLAQSLSLVTGGLNEWKVAKDVISLLLVIISVGAVFYYKKSTKLYRQILVLSLIYFGLHIGLYFRQKHTTFGVASLATVYNVRLFWYLLIGYSAALLSPKKIDFNRIINLVLVISSIVALIGILQYFLPKDLLTHFGYSVGRGVKPFFFIDDKPNLPRIMSTLRDPNSLGAFLILPICLIVSKLWLSRQKMLYAGLVLLHGLALLLTFSRSAWAGTFLSVSLVLYWQNKTVAINFIKKYFLLLVVGFLIIGGLVYSTRHYYFVENYIAHSDKNTTQQGSTQKHATQIQEGSRGIAAKPLGHGPGTAGLVSIHNDGGGLLPENYYLQIGYEVGLIGLGIFIAIQYLIYTKLSLAEVPIALKASFWGLLICALLLQTWSNEAVAAEWWLLAGLSIGQITTVTNRKYLT